MSSAAADRYIAKHKVVRTYPAAQRVLDAAYDDPALTTEDWADILKSKLVRKRDHLYRVERNRANIKRRRRQYRAGLLMAVHI